MKNVANMPVMMQPRITLEPVNVRNFKMRSGMIGLDSRDSRTMKATKSATAPARGIKVSGELHPTRAAVTTP